MHIVEPESGALSAYLQVGGRSSLSPSSNAYDYVTTYLRGISIVAHASRLDVCRWFLSSFDYLPDVIPADSRADEVRYLERNSADDFAIPHGAASAADNPKSISRPAQRKARDHTVRLCNVRDGRQRSD